MVKNGRGVVRLNRLAERQQAEFEMTLVGGFRDAAHKAQEFGERRIARFARQLLQGLAGGTSHEFCVRVRSGGDALGNQFPRYNGAPRPS
ncbi:hypothetical protein HA464_06785 [Rhizobium leguminosarum bv. trifolii]|nr:hypothetical protein HA464_06785 [Rhizobium leguminosarum bv. trifolii]TBE87031.1 hypothetical protein ELG99_09295 [Rhizobium ruizarguesonis]